MSFIEEKLTGKKFYFLFSSQFCHGYVLDQLRKLETLLSEFFPRHSN